MKKDMITIIDQNGNSQEMELILSYHDELNDIQYILYKREGKQAECFAAKSKQSNNGLMLDPNLNQRELEMLKLILMESENNENSN